MNEASPTGLRRLTATPSRGEYLAQLWTRRQFAVTVPLRDLRARNMNNVLGMLWFLLNPILLVAVYYLFFGVIVGTRGGVPNFLTFLAAGVFTFSYLQRSITGASRTIVTNVGLIRAIRFPRAILPLSETIGQTIAHLPAVAVLIALALVTGEQPRWSWLALFPLVAFQAMFALGVGFGLARLMTGVRDLQSFMPFVFRLVFYMSGVLYAVDRFVQNETYRDLFALNPFYDHIVLVRWALLGWTVDPLEIVAAVVWTVLVLPFGFDFFRRGEPYGRA